MKTLASYLRMTAILAALAVPGLVSAATVFSPTSFELVYQPIYTTANGGTTSQVSPLGAGLRLGFGMTSAIAFELGGYYDGYTFGGINGANATAYAARATADFAVAPHPGIRIYAGADANVFFSPPSGLVTTNNQDIGVIGGIRVLIGGGTTKLLFGTEYRYATTSALTYAGGSINPSAVIGTLGLHFGGL